jgi:hypothetical protein
MKICVTAVAVVVCLFSPILTFAQTSNATLGGTVSDSTGALLPGVSITATNVGTGIVTTVISNDSGAYQFANLQTGTYAVNAELPGFQKQARNGVVLGVSQQVRLNFTLQVGGVAQEVEVTVAADTLIATSSSSVGTVLPEYKVRDLPLGGRNVMGLLATAGGTGPTEDNFQGNFAGGRLSAVNVTRDGFNVTDGRYNYGALTSTYTSPDLVEEIRVITAPVDAEYGRGSGQVQMVTRSGTNQFRGSAFWTNRNSALDATKWFNNFNRAPKDYENRNQFGVRLGGPLIKNKTFFFFLLDEQRYVIRQTFVGTVLTEQARQGIFRHFPGVDNQNTTGLNPTVDRNGNPILNGQSAVPQSFSVFNRDSNRMGPDPSGFIQNTLIAKMPKPNDFTVGDGLNTAGIRFTRRVDGYDLAGSNGNDTNRDQFNARVDHNFNSSHKLSFIYTYERGRNMATQAGIMAWPGGYNGVNWKDPRLMNVSLVSTLSPTLVNEFRVGWKTEDKLSRAPWYVGRPSGFTPEEETVETGEQGKDAFALLPKYNGVPTQVVTTLFPNNIIDWTQGQGANRSAKSPMLTYGDNLSWTKGVHAFKWGGELRFAHSISANDSNMTPITRLGAGGAAVLGIDNTAFPGLTGNNQTLARNLLIDLSGSVASIQEGFDIRDPKDTAFRGYKDGVKFRVRDWRATDFNLFFKDSWKVHPNLTLNAGMSYWYFGVPYENHGLAGTAIGGEKGACGISCGPSLTTIEFVGKNSPNPGKQLFDDDWNNFAPSFGLSWSLPWFGKDKTVLRAGYGWNYAGNNLIGVNTNLENIGNPPGVFEGSAGAGITYTQSAYLSLANMTLPIPHQFAPLRPVPLDGGRGDTLHVAVADRVAPYIQNFNLEIQRELPANTTLSMSYVGTKSTKLWNGDPLNAVDIFNNQFLDAFNITRAGGDARLFDDMLRGLNVPGAGTVNGTTLTGSAALRASTNTRPFIANNNVGALANFLNTTTSFTGKGGGAYSTNGLPQNFFVANPQFSNAILHGNLSNSTYHSMLLQVTKRLSKGFTSQGSYTWSRTLGADVTNGAEDQVLNSRDPKRRSSDKTLVTYHRTHNLTANGTYVLPFGPGYRILGNAPGFLQRLVERWQFGTVFSWASGPPLTISAPTSTIWQTATNMTPSIVGDFPKSSGKVAKLPNAVTYFPDLRQVDDPTKAGVTTLQSTQGSFTNKAISDSQGRLLLVNPAAGQVGSLGLRWIQGPPHLGLDMNLIKRVRISENKEFEFRVDTVNILNHPNFGYNTNRDTQNNPFLLDLNINSPTFGRFTDAQGARRFTLSGRLNF